MASFKPHSSNSYGRLPHNVFYSEKKNYRKLSPEPPSSLSHRFHGLRNQLKLVKSPRVICHSSPTPGPFCVTDYLSRIITSHSAQACDGQPLRLHCPRHSTISVQSAFYGSGAAAPCPSDPDPPLGAHNRSCSAFTALQVRFTAWAVHLFSFHSHWVTCV